jgi:hypothetical protein
MKIMKSIKHWIKWNIATPFCHLFGMVAPTDWISAYSFMSKRILPYLKSFKKHEKMGYPAFFLSDPYRKEMMEKGYIFNTNTHSYVNDVIDNLDADEYITKLWGEMIDEIIFAVEQTIDEDDSFYMVPNPLYNPDQKEFFTSVPLESDPELMEMKFNDDYGKTKIDSKKYEEYHQRVQNGMELLGKHWQSLWD